jgi:hypothetical protein
MLLHDPCLGSAPADDEPTGFNKVFAETAHRTPRAGKHCAAVCGLLDTPVHAATPYLGWSARSPHRLKSEAHGRRQTRDLVLPGWTAVERPPVEEQRDEGADLGLLAKGKDERDAAT